jgi:hypothetical protein
MKITSPQFSRRFAAGIAASALLMCAVAQAHGQSASFTTQTYPLLGNTQIAADFNRDGKLDLAGSGAQNASVMLGNGEGTFRPKTDFAIGVATQDVTAGDFNGDGNLDLAVGLASPQVSVALLLGTGTGTFGAPTFLPNHTGFDSPAVLAPDLNNDGKLDIVAMHSIACFSTPCSGARSVTVYMGNGDGTFQPAREMDVNTYPHSMAVGDFNRDGIKDLAVGGENTELSILLGLGDGNFTRLPILMLVAGGDLFSACNDIDIADFNRDGIQDITSPLGNGNGNAIALGNGDGTFRRGTPFLEDAVSAPQSSAVADYNGDGLLDIARGVADGNRGLLQVLHGNGDGTFRPIVRYSVPPAGTSLGGGWVIAADFNADSKPDLALQVRGSGPATNILVNTTGGVVSPTAPTVSALTLNPSSVTGGSASTGTVTLSTRAQTATTVQLASNSAAARVPASVTVAAGASTASFSVSTSQVTSTTSAQITATANGTSRGAALTINATAPVADSVSITRAEYERSKTTLRVEATSSRSTATLQVFVTSTGQLIGTLSNNGGGRYGGQLSWSTNPQSITIRSNFGGSASRTVTLK